MISRDKATALLKKYIKTENTIKHMVACEAIMRSLASKLKTQNSKLKTKENFDENIWGIAGLLHDLDYEKASEREHGKLTDKILEEEDIDLPPEVIQTIQAHSFNLHPEFKPKTKMDWSLFICDSLTGLIVATVLVHPDKKLASVKVKSVMKKFKDKAFARGTRREDIKLCEEKLGISLSEFVEIGLKAMQEVAEQLGL